MRFATDDRVVSQRKGVLCYRCITLKGPKYKKGRPRRVMDPRQEGFVGAVPEMMPASWVLAPTMSMTDEREKEPVVV